MLQVRELVEECQCASQFSMIRLSEGKYRIGDTATKIFVRVSSMSLLLSCWGKTNTCDLDSAKPCDGPGGRGMGHPAELSR